jgi:hypothetical protein
MVKSKILQGAKVVALVTCMFAAFGAGISLIWSTFVSGESSSAEEWIASVVTGGAKAAFCGLVLSILLLLLTRDKAATEPALDSSISKKRTLLQWLWFAFPTVATTVTTILCLWILLAGYTADSPMFYTNLALIVFFSSGSFLFLRQFLHELFEASDTALSGDNLLVNYVHLGERHFVLNTSQFSKTKITQMRPKVSEPMWRVHFSGWRFAVLPVDWDNSLETATVNPTQ